MTKTSACSPGAWPAWVQGVHPRLDGPSPALATSHSHTRGKSAGGMPGQNSVCATGTHSRGQKGQGKSGVGGGGVSAFQRAMEWATGGTPEKTSR